MKDTEKTPISILAGGFALILAVLVVASSWHMGAGFFVASWILIGVIGWIKGEREKEREGGGYVVIEDDPIADSSSDIRETP